MVAQVGSLREVLAQQPVGVLVAGPLPRAGLLAEVHRHAQRGGDLGVQRHLAALVPGQRPAQLRRQVLHRVDDGVADGVGGVPAGQVQQDRVPARPLDQGPDRRAVGLAGDQVAFPMPGDLTVGRLFRPLVDHRHVGQPTAALLATAMRLAAQPAGTQCLGQLPAQATEVRTVDRLVDGLRHDVTLGPARELGSKSLSNLLWTPPSLEPALHERAQLNVGDELARLRPCPPLLGQPLRRVRAVRTALRIDVAAQFPTHRRGIAAQLAGDRPNSFTSTAQVSDTNPLVLGQEPCRDLPLARNTDHGRIVQPLTAAACHMSDGRRGRWRAQGAVRTCDPAVRAGGRHA